MTSERKISGDIAVKLCERTCPIDQDGGYGAACVRFNKRVSSINVYGNIRYLCCEQCLVEKEGETAHETNNKPTD